MQSTHERTSWVLPVPYHASTDQVLGFNSTTKIFDQNALLSRGQFKGSEIISFEIENIGDVDIDTITFKDSKTGVFNDFAAVLDSFYGSGSDDYNDPTIVAGGRVAGQLIMNPDTLYLQVLGHNEAGPASIGQIRLTLTKIGGGHMIEAS
jgi:hypothetical protein